METLNKKIETAEKLPGLMFEDITDRSEENKPIADAQPINDSATPLVSDNEILSAGNDFKGENDTFTRNQPTTPIIPTAANAAQPYQPSQSGTKAGQLVSGKFATDLLDSLCPAIIVYCAAAMGYNARKSELQLSASEKQTIAPAMQSYLDTLKIDFNNPLYNLLFVVGMIYGAKVIERAPDMQKKEKRAAPVRSIATPTTTPQTKEEKFEELVQRIMKQRKKGRADAVNFIKKQQDKKRA
jgi:hypothetical protein